MQERVQKLLAQWGIASRRHAEQMILEGRVRVNGAIAQLGQRADPQHDRLEVDGTPIAPAARPQSLYLLLNKPLGVVSTCTDPQWRRTVLDLLPAELRQNQGLHPIGRLDVDSTGALLLTNDGSLTFQLTHPRHHVSKTYRVWVEGNPSDAVLQQWRQGVMLDGKRTLPAGVRRLKREADRTLLEIKLREGRNRQIRRVAEQLGYPVLKLHRIAIGNIQLQSPGEPELKPGSYRNLNPEELASLKEQLGIPSVKGFVERKDDDL